MNTHNPLIKIKEASNLCAVCHTKEFCICSGLSEQDLKWFVDTVGHNDPIDKGDKLFAAGDQLDSLYLVHSGSVKSYVESIGGDIQITGFYFPGDLIGVKGIEHRVHTDTVAALETCSVCELQFTDFDDICDAFPVLHRQLMCSIMREIEHDQKKLLVLGKMKAKRRIAYFLLDLAWRMETHGLSGKRLYLPMSRNDIANYLALAVETVSRTLTQLQKANIIKVKSRSIVIRDKVSLQNIYHHTQSSTEDLESSI